MSRSSFTAPRSKMKKKARKPSEFARIYGSRERVKWVKAQPCIAAHFGCVGAIENAHVVNGGMGRKADSRYIVAACNHHHAEMHAGVESFEAKYRVNLMVAASVTEDLWQRHSARAASHREER